MHRAFRMGESFRLRPGDTVRIRGERWVVHQQSTLGDVSVLDVRGADGGNGGQRVRFLLPFEPVESLPAPSAVRVVRPGEWRRAARAALAAATSSPDSLRAAARARFDVMPYQLEPVLAVTGGCGCRLLIADEVGLGKTVQAGLVIAELLERYPNGRALVVCPAGLRSQWQDELAGRFGLSAVLLDSAGISRFTSEYEAAANPWSAAPLIITSIDFIKRPEVMRAVEGLIWDVLVLDEAHHLASRSDRATAAGALAWRARTLVMLSATPHSGDEAAFARLCALGDVRGRFPLLFFRRTRRDTGLPVQRRTTWLHIRLSTAEARMHAALMAYAERVWNEPDTGGGGRLAMAVLLRRAASSAESLVCSLDRRRSALATGDAIPAAQLGLPFGESDADDEPVASLSAPGLSDRSEERRLLEELSGLARAAAIRESKVAAIRRLLARVDEPVLIFTEYRDTLMRWKDALAAGSRPAGRIVELHGGLTRSERENAEHRFAHGDADVLLATDAASEGLNLHHRCRLVVNIEIPWNPVRLEQRIGRVDRIGQRKRVHAVQLVASDTFELNTVKRLVTRAAAAANALRSAPAAIEATAAAVLTGVELPDCVTSPVAPAALCRVDLAGRAQVEAADIVRARLLAEESPLLPQRAVCTILHPRGRRLICAFELTLTDADGLPVWTTVLGVGALAAGRAWTPTDMRQAVNAAGSSIEVAADSLARRLRDRAAQIIRPLTTVGLDREHAIAAAVRLRHARVAADLLQPGLFDRRAERAASSQSLTLEEALGRCHDRLASLAGLTALQHDALRLRFAVLVR